MEQQAKLIKENSNYLRYFKVQFDLRRLDVRQISALISNMRSFECDSLNELACIIENA